MIFLTYTLSQIHTHIRLLTHEDAHTQTYSWTITNSLSHTLTLTQSLTHLHTCTQGLSHTLFHSLKYEDTHKSIYTCSLIHPETNTLTYTRKHVNIHANFLFYSLFSLFLIFSYTHRHMNKKIVSKKHLGQQKRKDMYENKTMVIMNKANRDYQLKRQLETCVQDIKWWVMGSLKQNWCNQFKGMECLVEEGVGKSAQYWN